MSVQLFRRGGKPRDLFTRASEIPADQQEWFAELRAHFRYPEDLFRVQTGLYGRYQIENPGQFFSGDLRWNVAQNPSSQPQTDADGNTSIVTSTTEARREADTGNVAEPDSPRFVPYYSMFHDPSGTPTFSLLQPFVPFSSNDSVKNLAGYMTVSSNPDTYGQLTLYRMQGAEHPGPAEAVAAMDSNTAIASEINVLARGGSAVVYGNLQMVPISEGLLYVRPVYIQPSGRQEGQLYLRQVIVAYRGSAVMGDTLTAAINELFPDAGVDLGEVVGGTPVTPPDGETPEDRDPAELLAEAEELFARADQALSDPGGPEGFQEYARLTEEARQLVSDALAQLDTTTLTRVPGEDDPEGDVTEDTTLDDIESGTAPGSDTAEGGAANGSTLPTATPTTAPAG